MKKNIITIFRFVGPSAIVGVAASLWFDMNFIDTVILALFLMLIHGFFLLLYSDLSRKLQIAVEKEDLKTIKRLIMINVNVNICTQGVKSRTTLLHSAVRKQNKKIVKVLLDAGALAHSFSNEGMWASLFLEAKDDEIIQLFIDAGVDVAQLINSTVHENQGLLPYVALRGEIDSWKRLIKFGGNIHTFDGGEDPVLHCSVATGSVEQVEMALSDGANVHAVDSEGSPVLFGPVRQVMFGIIQVLVNHGADINKCDNENCSVMHLAAGRGRLELFKYLIDIGADMHVATNDGVTILHVAASSGHDEIVKFALDSELDPNAKNSKGFTPLHFAISDHPCLETIKLLIDAKADITATNDDMKTPLDIARKKNNPDVVNLLTAAHNKEK